MANNDKRNEVTNGVSVPDAPQQEGAFLSELRALAAQLDTMNLRDVGGRRYGDLVLCAVRALSGSVPEATAAEVRRLTHELDNAQQALRRVGLLPIREPTPDATAGSGEAGAVDWPMVGGYSALGLLRSVIDEMCAGQYLSREERESTNYEVSIDAWRQDLAKVSRALGGMRLAPKPGREPIAWLVMWRGKPVGFATKESVSLVMLAEGESLLPVAALAGEAE